MNCPLYYEHLFERLKQKEGFRDKPYDDATGETIFAPRGKLTIAFGRNIQDVGINVSEGEHLLQNDIATAIGACEHYLKFFPELNDARKMALVEMAFNMGIGSLLGFTNMLQAFREKDYERASVEALDSQWARGPVGERAREIAEIILTGKF